MDHDQLEDLKQNGVRTIRLLYCDCSGLRKCRSYDLTPNSNRAFPVARWSEVKACGIGSCEGNVAATAFVDMVVPGSGLGIQGEIRLMPSGVPLQLPWHRSHAMVFADQHRTPGSHFGACPRLALVTTLQYFRKSLGVHFKAGFETEFYLLQPEHRAGQELALHPVDASLYCQTSSFDAVASVLDEIVDTLAELDIAVEQVHAEAGTGQFEIVTTFAEPLEAADKLVYTREAIAATAAKHGLVASFLPKTAPDQAGSACHCHISIWKDGVSLMKDFPLRARAETVTAPQQCLAEAFVAGLLHHLPALALWTLPSPVSCHRVQPSTWSGAYRVWGVHNREATLRVCPTADGSSVSNVEYKAIDNCTNPHLALAAIIAAGCTGLGAEQLTLPPACSVDPASLLEEERTQRGLRPLQATLDAMLQAWDSDSALQQQMGTCMSPAMVQCFLAVRQHENELWKDKYADSHFDAVGYPPWLLRRY